MATYKITYATSTGIKKDICCSFNDVKSAIKAMIELGIEQAKEFVLEGLDEVTSYMTSNEEYPDAWGFGNNGFCIRYNEQWYQYEVIEA